MPLSSIKTLIVLTRTMEAWMPCSTWYLNPMLGSSC
jgi:hypothetical protein